MYNNLKKDKQMAKLTKYLSRELTLEFGSGFTVGQLEFCRQFYRAFPIANAQIAYAYQ